MKDSTQQPDFEVIVVGGGIAGAASALRASQYRLRTLWVLGDKATAKRSRSQWVANIDNMIGIHDGLVRAKLAPKLKRSGVEGAEEALRQIPHLHLSTRDIVSNTRDRIIGQYAERTSLEDFAATRARRHGENFVVQPSDEREFSASSLVLATGVMDEQPSVKKAKGEEVIDDLKWIYPFANRESVLYCIRCEGHLTTSARASVIGHSETAAQLALMLYERYESTCVLLTNGETPSWTDETGRALAAYGIDVQGERIVDLDGSKGELKTITLEGGKVLDLRFALVSLGLHRVYNELAQQLGADISEDVISGAGISEELQPVEKRHVTVDSRSETSIPGLFAVGDMARRTDEPVMKQVYTAQEYAVRAVDTVDRRLRLKRRKAALEA